LNYLSRQNLILFKQKFVPGEQDAPKYHEVTQLAKKKDYKQLSNILPAGKINIL
jgi:hypothetical protein